MVYNIVINFELHIYRLSCIVDSMNKEFCIWLAGFVDGEGCININHNPNGHPHFRLIITQNDLGVLQDIQKRIGGGAIIQKSGKARSKIWKDTYDLVMSKKIAKPVVDKILPYTKVKTRQLLLFKSAIHAWETERIRPSQEWKTIVR